MIKPVLAIVGRPNVGKSTIFNRFAGERIAIVEDKPGVTRDRIYSSSEWLDVEFNIIDTGGIEVQGEDIIIKQTRMQAELAMDEADVILFIVDGKSGITETDKEIAKILHRSKKPVILGVNKIDNPSMLHNIHDFYELGFYDIFPISGEHATGLGDLLEKIIMLFPKVKEEESYDEDIIKVAFIGRPNVGKSSLVNAILGEERVIVSPIAGTTRDAIDTLFEHDGQKYVLIDTAGMRKKGKIYETTEKYSVLRALKAIERSDVILVVLDAETGIIEQDKKIAGYAHEAGKAVILVINKWDAIEKNDKTMHEFSKNVTQEFQFISYAPQVFVSAKTKQRINQLLPLVSNIAEFHSMRINTSLLNDVISDAIVTTPPPTDKGKRLRINYVTQVGVKPPSFVFFVNDPELMHFSYERFLENRIREAFQFIGTPIRIIIKKKSVES